MSLAQETRTLTFPYPGLRPYDQSEADLFFGREEHVDQLLGKLEVHRFLAVIGPSGCGKSSLVRAGLLPALETGFMASAGIHWRSAVLRPESEPLRNLAKALLDAQALGSQTEDLREELGFLAATLRRGPLGLVEAVRAANLPERTNLLVLVDQFEELFRFHRLGGTSESNAFVDLLLASANEPSESIYVVLTMRSDYLGNCPVFRGLPEAMNESQFLTPRLTREQNRAAIVGPAAMFGVKVEPEVVTRILNEMGTDPDQLPLMQHLLMRMWRRVTQGRTESDYGGQLTITMDDYESVGGLANALSTHIERIYQELPDGGSKKIAETAFRNLTDITPDGQVIRRPVKLSEISEIAEASTEQVAAVLDAFREEGRSFLMPPISTSLSKDSVIDISHESLIRQWKRLKDWTKDEDKARQTARSVEAGQRKWKETRQNEQALLHGLRLLEAEEWAKTHPHQVEPAEQDFLDASRNHVEHEARFKRILGRLIGALALISVILLVWCYIQLRTTRAQERELRRTQEGLIYQKNQAEKLKRDANESADVARSNLRENLETKAKGLAAASRRLLERGDASGALTLAVEAKNTTMPSGGSMPKEVERAFLSALGSQKITPRLLASLTGGDEIVSLVAFSPDGSFLVTGGSGPTAQLRRLEGGSGQTTAIDLEGHFQSVNMVSLSAGQHRVATLDHDGLVRLWTLKLNDPDARPVLLKQQSGQASVMALSADGRWLAAGGKSGKLWLWPVDGSDQSAPITLPGHSKDILALTFDAGSRWLATADQDGMVRLWDLTIVAKPPASSRELANHTGPVYALAFSRDGQRLCSASSNGSLRLWELRSGGSADAMVLRSSGTGLLSLAFSPDGQRLAAGGMLGLIQVWNVEAPKAPPVIVRGPVQAISKLEFSPRAGRWLAARDYTGSIWLWEISGITPIMVSLPGAPSNSSSTRMYFPPGAPPIPPAHLGGFAFHPDGQSLVTINGQTGLMKGGLLSWDLANIGLTSSFDPFISREPGDDLLQTVLDPGRDLQAQSSGAGSAGQAGRLWSVDDADTSAAPVFLNAPGLYNQNPIKTHVAAAAFGPDGRTVALACPDGTIKLWDAARLGPTAASLLGRPGPVVHALAFSPTIAGGYRWLASGDEKGTVRLWNLDARQATDPSAEHCASQGDILSIAFSPDGRWLVIGSTSVVGLTSAAWFWDLKDNPPAKPITLPGRRGVSTNALAFHPKDPRWVACGGSDGEILLWNLSEIQAKDNPKRLSGHNRAPITRLQFTPDGARIISAEDRTAQLWSFDGGNPVSRPVELARHIGGITCLAVSPDAEARWLATGGSDGQVQLCRLDVEPFESRRIPLEGSVSAVLDLAFSDDSRWLAISSEDKHVQVVSVDGSGRAPQAPILLGDQDQACTSVIMAPDGRLVIGSGPDGTVRVWPLRWQPGLDTLARRLAVRNLTAEELDQHFPEQEYHRTFDHLPVHYSVIELARRLAKQGQTVEAMDRLTELKQIDTGLECDSQALIDLSKAEGLLRNAKMFAGRGGKERTKAIELFRAAKQLVPGSSLDAESEADRYEALSLIAELDGLINEEVEKIRNNPNPQSHSPLPLGDTAGASSGIRLANAKRRFDRLKDLNKRNPASLFVEIVRVSERLKALELDKEARHLASKVDGLDGAVEKFANALKMDFHLGYQPNAEARKVSLVVAQLADSEGTRLVRQGNIEDAVKEFEKARKLAPEKYKEPPRDRALNLVPRLASDADKEGRQLAAQAKTQEALDAFREAHTLAPKAYSYSPEEEVSRAIADTTLGQADGWLGQLQSQVQINRPDLAEKTFEQAKLKDPSLAFVPQDYVNRVRARQLMLQGRTMARALQLDQAIEKFRQAQRLNSELEFDPEQLARRHVGMAYIARARYLALTTGHEDAKAALKKGLELLTDLKPQEPNRSLDIDAEKQVRLLPALSGVQINLNTRTNPALHSLCRQGFIDEAYSIYERATHVDPLVEVSAEFWNSLCWSAATKDVEGAKRYGFASDLALALEPENDNFRDTRGLVRALLGDRKGAIRDFEAYISFAQNFKRRKERWDLIRLLRSDTPIARIFTPEVLKQLKTE